MPIHNNRRPDDPRALRTADSRWSLAVAPPLMAIILMMYRLLKRGLFIMVVWGLPMVCVALWGLGLRYEAGIEITVPDGHFELVTSDGAAVVLVMPYDRWGRLRADTGDVVPESPLVHFVAYPKRTFHHAVHPFRHRTSKVGANLYRIAWWSLTLITLLPAMFIYFPGRRKRRRRKLGLCTRCGYDLRGQSDDSSGCPECGHPRR